MTEQEQDLEPVPFDCPIDGCDYTTASDGAYERDRLAHEHDAEMHYEREHAGRVRIKVVLETEQLLGGRDPMDVADHHFDRMSEDDRTPFGYDVAYTVAEVIEESDVGENDD